MTFGAIDKFMVITFFSSVDDHHLVQLPAVSLPSGAEAAQQRQLSVAASGPKLLR